MAKRVKLPKEGLVEPEERGRLIDNTDVEGHGLPTTAPPDSLIRRGPGNGGESARQQHDDDDVEGPAHRS